MALETLHVELTIVLGKARMPMHRLLRLGRGALVALEPGEEDVVEILANGLPIATGRVSVKDGAVQVEVLALARKPETTRAPGTTLGSHYRLDTEASSPSAIAA